MLTMNKSKYALVPFVSGVFLAGTILPANSAISGQSSYIESDTSAQGTIFQQSEPLTLNDPTIVIAFGNSATAAIIRPLNDATAECRSKGAEYAASCAAAAYKKAARAASRPDYRDARRELNNAAKKLERLVSRNVDRSAKKKKGKNGTYKAVKKEAVAKVNREALKIIQETQTKLLRSSGSGQRKVHYQKIAQAVGSTKVIFRS